MTYNKIMSVLKVKEYLNQKKAQFVVLLRTSDNKIQHVRRVCDDKFFRTGQHIATTKELRGKIEWCKKYNIISFLNDNINVKLQITEYIEGLGFKLYNETEMEIDLLELIDF